MSDDTILRPFSWSDVPAITRIYRHYVEHTAITFDTEAPDEAGIAEKYAGLMKLGHPVIIAEREGRTIGYAYASKFRDRPAYRYVCETSIYLTDTSSGSGVGRLLYEALIDTLRAQGFVQAIGTITMPNDRSIKLHEAVGFRRQGVLREVGHKHGRWIDVGFWQCELNEARVPPAEPRPFSETGVVRG